MSNNETKQRMKDGEPTPLPADSEPRKGTDELSEDALSEIDGGQLSTTTSGSTTIISKVPSINPHADSY